MQLKANLQKAFNQHEATIRETIETCEKSIISAAKLCVETLQMGQTIFLFGNGGSSTDAMHIAAEFTGKYEAGNRKALPAIALTADNAAISSIGNDFGFEFIFSRQIEALAKKGDLCIGISTSGRSPNVTLALKKAENLGCKTVALTGKDGGNLTLYADVSIIVPSANTSRIQEAHILIGHCICEWVEKNFLHT